MTRPALVLSSLLAFLPVAAVPAARAEMLKDSTTVQAWTLPNGLEVRVRDVPGARSVALTLAYRAGTWIEAGSQPELASVLAQVQFTAPVGDVPERPVEEMNSVRPLGWGVTANPHLALLTELGPADRLPGLLREVAMRARGVQVTDSCLAHVKAGVRRDFGAGRFGGIEPALYHRVRDLALGVDDGQLVVRAGPGALAKLTPARVDSLLRRYYVASNACLALVGDFGDVNLRSLVEREFGPMPAGSPQPDPPAQKLASSAHEAVLNGATPAAVIGILAPALEDTLHPAFYLSTVFLGGWWTRNLRDAGSPLESHFQYSVLDEPELARFDIQLPDTRMNAAAVSQRWNASIEEYAEMAITSDVRDLVRSNVRWLLGGPLSTAQVRQAIATPVFLSSIANTTATRALWKGDAFWALYRDRFERANFVATTFREWLEAPEHQVVLLLKPGR